MNEQDKGKDLIYFTDENDIISQSMMAPFPLYVAMLCLMWHEMGENKRKDCIKTPNIFTIIQGNGPFSERALHPQRFP